MGEMDIKEFKNIACQRIKTKRQTGEIPSSTKYSQIQKKGINMKIFIITLLMKAKKLEIMYVSNHRVIN